MAERSCSAPAMPEMAFARPGQEWRTVAVQPALLEPGALAKSGLLPADFAPALAEDALLPVWDYFRELFRHAAQADTDSSTSR